MADSDTTARDTLTRARRERRRLLLGASASGSLMMTLPTRRLFAGTKKKKNHGSVWCSFCQAKKKNVKLSNTPITTTCGDSPTTWQGYVGSSNSNDCPVGWGSWNFETYFPRPTGYSWYLNGSKQSSTTHPTFAQCIYGQVTYKNGGTTIGSSYAQQAACSYINAYYYSCNGTSFYNNKQCTDVTTDFHNNSPTHLITCATKWSAYNTD
jgi:hypothetical protein